ncbi:hypothetical protein FB567DRAFT_593772 [Paraphoma chrysanthemicola]|uniref:Uncharacterized protein n=1 Tax=Paraphoma chrysanthemicola TaxID=798071 RepID=A0A8K0VWZ3_9PLEO|nr:hypothetical protein FB567DRAFT_593772 [Paraphoma chrysanthemicola]
MAQRNNHQSNIGAGMTREQQIIQYNQHLEEQRRLQDAALAGSNNSPRMPQQAPNIAQVQYMQQQMMQQSPVGNPNVGGRNRPSGLSPQQQARYMSQMQRQPSVSNSSLGGVNGANNTPTQRAACPFQQHVSFGLPGELNIQSQQQYGDDQIQSLQLQQHLHRQQLQQNSQSQAQFNGYNQFVNPQQEQQQQQQQQLARSRTYQAQSQHAQASATMNSPQAGSPAGALTPPNDVSQQHQLYSHPPTQQTQANATPTAPMTQPAYITPPSNSPQRSHISQPSQQNVQGQQHARTVSLSNMKDANEALRRVNNVSSYGPPIQDKVQQQLMQDRLRANANAKANANTAARTNGNQQSPYSTPRPGTLQQPQQRPQQQPQQQQTQQKGSPGTKRKHQVDDPLEQQAIMDARRKQLEAERHIQQQKAIQARQLEENHRQQEAMRKRQEEESQRQLCAQVEAAQRRQQEQHAAEHRERVRIAEEQRLERERKAIHKQQLKKDRSSLYRYYDEYLEHFPLGVGERRNQYLNNLLANRRMPEDRNSDLGLAIQYAKDHWEFYTEYNSKTVKECAEDQRKALEGRGEKVPLREEVR